MHVSDVRADPHIRAVEEQAPARAVEVQDVFIGEAHAGDGAVAGEGSQQRAIRRRQRCGGCGRGTGGGGVGGCGCIGGRARFGRRGRRSRRGRRDFIHLAVDEVGVTIVIDSAIHNVETLCSRAVARRSVCQPCCGSRVRRRNINSLKQSAAGRGFDDDRSVLIAAHDEQSAGRGVELNRLRVKYSVRQNIELVHERPRQRILVNLRVDPIRHKQMVIHRAVGNAFRVAIAKGAG